MLRYHPALRTICAALAAALAGLVLLVPAASADDALAVEEQRMLEMVNDHRIEQGLRPLKMHDGLRKMARRHTHDMAAEGDIFHNPDMVSDANAAAPGWRLLGENVGVGPSTASVQDAFLDSPKHRENIETQAFTVAGIGAVRGPDDRLYFTQNFAEWEPQPDPTPVPKATAPPPSTAPPPTAAPTAPPPAPTAEPGRVSTAFAEGPVRTAATAKSTDARAKDATTDSDGGVVGTLFALLSRLVGSLAFWT